MIAKSYDEFMEILMNKKKEKLASLPDHVTVLPHKEKMDIFNEVSAENSNQDEMKLFLEKLQEIKPEEIKNA